jgi:uncharacterized membrane protein YbhN (UPF0104 family)
VTKAPETGGKSRVTTVLKAVVTVAILALVLRKVPLHDLGARLGRLRASDVAVLLVLTALQVTVGVWRWRRLLVRLGERVPFFSLYGDALVGLTYNMFLPTTVGGDVMRALRARKRVERTHRAWSTSLYERIAGLLAMAASGALAALVGVGAQVPGTIRVVAGVLTVALLVVFFAAAAPFRLLLRILERRLPSALGVADDVRGIVDDLEGPLSRSAARVETLAWSLLYQALGVAFVIAGARGLGAPGHELAIVVGVPLVHVLSMLPITIGGLGLREGLFVAILGRLGVESDVALGLAAQWLASSLMFAIAGAIVAIADPSPKAPGMNPGAPTAP